MIIQIVSLTFVIAGFVLGAYIWINKAKLKESKDKRKKIIWKIFLYSFFIVISAFIIVSLIRYLPKMFFSPDYTFKKNITGILVLQFEGDDLTNSLQHDLVSTLNTELSKEQANRNIEVHAYNKKVTEKFGIIKAHKKVRKHGKRTNAFLVIWGTRIGKNKIHPRITIVEDEKYDFFVTGERAMVAKIIGEANLPSELVNKPISLAHFITGYNYYNLGDFSSALNHFDKSIKSEIEDSTQLSDIQFYIGTSHLLISQGNKKMNWHLENAIENYNRAKNYYKLKDYSIQFASTINNLGIAYAQLTTGNRTKNLRSAIDSFESALKIFNKDNFPLEYIQTENNLGVVSVELSIIDQNTNVQNIINKFDAILHQHKLKKNHSLLWAMIQNNLGTTYLNLQTGNNVENIQRAIIAFESALDFYNKYNFPTNWATISNNLYHFNFLMS